MQQLKPCVFMDRDGIVNAVPTDGARYIERPEDFHILPDFLAVLRVVNHLGYEAVIVTNQKGVGTGHISAETLQAIHRKLLDTVRHHKLRLLDIRVSTATDDAHPSRKPNPGLLLGAAADHGLDIQRSWMVGDQARDVEAGRRAGCRTIFVGNHAVPGADFVVPDLAALAALLRTRLDPVNR